jgi:hypothetical protein
MKNAISVLVVISLLFVGCNQMKEKETTEPVETSSVSLEGMWKLKSGVWDNEDGTFMRYPQDSLIDGPAYVIYSKSHLMTIAKSPGMDYFRGELAEYAIDGDSIMMKTSISNFETHEGMEATWAFTLEGNLLKTELGQNKEVWERVE